MHFLLADLIEYHNELEHQAYSVLSARPEKDSHGVLCWFLNLI